jgi:hypothetical protein
VAQFSYVQLVGFSSSGCIRFVDSYPTFALEIGNRSEDVSSRLSRHLRETRDTRIAGRAGVTRMVGKGQINPEISTVFRPAFPGETHQHHAHTQTYGAAGGPFVFF